MLRLVVLLACVAAVAAFSVGGVTPALRPRSAAAAMGVRAPRQALALNMVSGEEGRTKLKDFLEEAKKLGKLRLISQNDAAVMEAIATLDGLFYATGGPKQLEYANVIDPKINLDLHLLLDGVGSITPIVLHIHYAMSGPDIGFVALPGGARFETGISRTPTKDPTYVVRMLGNDAEKVVLSLFLQWDKEPSDISKDRIDAWSAMKEKYGEKVAF